MKHSELRHQPRHVNPRIQVKRGAYLTEKYFDEQLERIREIRASERMFYQKITDLYATAIDYDREVCG